MTRIKIKYNLLSYCLVILSILISSYSLYSNIRNTWLITPPNYIVLILCILAFVFSVKGLKNNTKWWHKIGNSLSILLSALLSIILASVIVITLFFSSGQKIINTTHSPDNNTTINFYRWDAGAMGTFGIRGELKGPLWFKKKIYYEVRTEQVEIEWINNQEVSINKHILNLDKGETYGYSK